MPDFTFTSTPAYASRTSYTVSAGTPIPDSSDVDALSKAVSSMANWRPVLIANGEPHDKYDADIAKARAALKRLEAFVGGRYG